MNLQLLNVNAPYACAPLHKCRVYCPLALINSLSIV